MLSAPHIGGVFDARSHNVAGMYAFDVAQGAVGDQWAKEHAVTGFGFDQEMDLRECGIAPIKIVVQIDQQCAYALATRAHKPDRNRVTCTRSRSPRSCPAKMHEHDRMPGTGSSAK